MSIAVPARARTLHDVLQDVTTYVGVPAAYDVILRSTFCDLAARSTGCDAVELSERLEQRSEVKTEAKCCGAITGCEDASSLGELYEQMLMMNDPRRRKAGGIYYTPPMIVDHIVDSTVRVLLKETDEPTIVDPSCGGGAFLLKAAQCIMRHNRAEDFDQRLQMVCTSIFGVDIDPIAVQITQMSLALLCLTGCTCDAGAVANVVNAINRNIRCGNSLIDAHDFDGVVASIQTFDWRNTFSDAFRNGGFDAVIGNPPYVSYSGRQAVAIPDAERRYFLHKYTSNRWPTAHGYFTERAVRDLSRRFTAFIVPDQVAHLAGYAPLRRLLAERGLKEIRYWGESIFQDAITPSLTFIVDRQHEGTTLIHERRGREVLVTLHDDMPWRCNRARHDEDHRFISLGDLVADPGVHTGNCASQLIARADSMDSASGEPEFAPVLEGRLISRYRCQRPMKVLRLNYLPGAGEYFTIRPYERYARAAFVIRQTANRPIVGPREHAVYFRNSLLALYAPQPPLDIRYLVGLLNSERLASIYREQVQESAQRAFPQVKVRSLRALPIRAIDFNRHEEIEAHGAIVALVDQMLQLHRHGGDASAIAKTDRRIERIVEKLYECNLQF